MPTSPAAPWEQYRAQLADFAKAAVNYDTEHPQDLTLANGWHLDHYRTALPPEAPGPPDPHGAFAAARDIIWHYRFPPPELIHGYFDPQQPLPERVMLLRARFAGFTFRFGVRIVDVRDEVADGPDGPEQVWGYGYRTLGGHFEMGQINFSVRKNLGTGRVEFHIDAVSKTGRIDNWFYRLGFKVFGRVLQKYFSHRSLGRMRRLVRRALASGQTMPPAGG